MAHNFKDYPELTNSQMRLYYWESPHKQIFQNFKAKVEKVHDGDTITISCDFRDFKFPIRFLKTNAPELNETGGADSRDWLRDLIEGQEIEVVIDPKQRVEKWGRLLGEILYQGMNINDLSMRIGYATKFEDRNRGKITPLNKIFEVN